MAKAAKETPMMKQYWEMRRSLPDDTLLLFRLGDFYEMFHGDAEEGARLLGITLTQRQGYPMAGIPYHAADTYIPRMLKVGKKVAICDQVETPKPGKLVKRSLTRILTPGTTLDDNQLQPGSNHYIVAIDLNADGLQAAWMDVSTGHFQIATAADPEQLMPILHAIGPKEIVVPEDAIAGWRQRGSGGMWFEALDQLLGSSTVTTVDAWHFDASTAMQPLLDVLGVLNLAGFGIADHHPALGTAAALVHYVGETLCSKPANLEKISVYEPDNTVRLDPATQRNLEIFHSAGGRRDGSLIAAIDHTQTAAGARLLEQYLAAPQIDTAEIERRQSCVQGFFDAPGASRRVGDALRKTRDLTRILGRLQNRIRNPRELGAIRATLSQLPQIRNDLAAFDEAAVAALAARIDPLPELADELNRALNDELPSDIKDGGCIRSGYDAELDRIRSLTRDNRTWIADLETREQESTGIRNLKVKYTSNFGYFIEVTKSNLHNVPEHYHRRQTMTNVERFTTDELRAKESEILNADERSIGREEALFNALVATILKDAPALHRNAVVLAEVDLFCGWAALAREWNYCRPVVDNSDVLQIEAGRHAVVEQMLHRQPGAIAGAHSFVPNDTALDCTSNQIALITGPNMAGKSTYIRQIALIALLAQIGCWVPASSCRIGCVDRIFSRVGASDELARGNSTFMVEMNETANILNNATDRSLIILDEIGRGTSTYDGLSIAWAVVEHLHGNGNSGPRTLFATHYHEMTQLEQALPRLHNYSVAVKEWNDEIIFVRQICPGAADRSYGIQVARLAGLPSAVVARARDILAELEQEGAVVSEHLKQRPETPPRAKTPARSPAPPPPQQKKIPGQMELF